MKKIFKLFCAVAAIAALASSCSEPKDEKGLQDSINETVVLTAGYDGTRTTLNESFTPLWQTGDKLWVYDGEHLVSAAVAEADNGKTSASFEFTGLTAGAAEYDGLYAGKSASVAMQTVGTFKATVHNDGTWNDAHVAVGKANKGNIRLYNVSTAIAFRTEDATLGQVRISGLIEDDEFPVVAFINMADTTIQNVDVTTELVATVGGAGTYYVGFFPVEGISGLKLTLVYGNGNIKVITINGTFNFKSNNILDLGLIDGREGKTYNVVSKNTFETVSGTIAEGFTYTSYQGDAATAPAINNGVIRLYQPKSGSVYGGRIEIASTGGDKITGLHLNVGNNTTVCVAIDGAAPVIEDSLSIKYNKGLNLSNLDCEKVTVYGVHPSNNNRLYIKGIDVTYIPDARTPQTLTFPNESYSATVGLPFTAPVVSGAQTTVTYTSSNTAVATVNESTGAVTLLTAGTTTITATAVANETYKKGTASYELTVAAAVEGVAGITEAISKNTSTPFAATLTDAIVTMVQEDGSSCYIEENGKALYLYRAFGSQAILKVGDKISGTVSGAGVLYNAFTPEVTAFDYSAATITHDNPVPLTTLTIAQLKENFMNYRYVRVKVEDAVVTDALTTSDRNGKIAQGTDTLAVYAQIKNTIAVDLGTNIDLIAFPCYYVNNGEGTPQLGIWAQADITAKGGEGVITMAPTKNMTVGGTWTIGATCNSGATITYSSNKTNIATVDPNTGVVTALAAGEATITASAPAANGFTAAQATCVITVVAAGGNEFSLYSGTITEGDYVIYYDGKAMKNTISSDRFGYLEVTPTNDVISNPDASIVWHIAASGDYWTIYNAAVSKYAASTGAKNKGQLLASGTDDKSLWTVTGSATYEFVNKANKANNVNCNLRNNGTYGFACYATGTGGALSLYKKN